MFTGCWQVGDKTWWQCDNCGRWLCWCCVLFAIRSVSSLKTENSLPLTDLYLIIATSVSSDYQLLVCPGHGWIFQQKLNIKTLQILLFSWEYSPMRQVRWPAPIPLNFPPSLSKQCPGRPVRGSTRKTRAAISMRVSPGAGLQLAILMVRTFS